MAKKQCSEKKNLKNCNCTYEPCKRKGVCCECLQYHWGMGELPACLFPNDVEATWDRSVERFVSTYQERGRWW
jgi:hypothetical protein